jgi:hypothetical protein
MRESFAPYTPKHHGEGLPQAGTEALDDLPKQDHIHTGYTTEDIETLLYQLKRYVDLALLFHIYSAPDFASIGESVS